MGARVLIIDDEPDVAAYLSTILRVNGHVPVSANSVEAGFQALAAGKPDVICLDIMMPKESGASMFLRLRQDSETRDIPVIVISGVELKDELDPFALPDRSILPPECFLEKPIKVDEFLAAIARVTSSGPRDPGEQGR